MKIRTLEELDDYLSNELAWRKKECSNLNGLTSSSRGSNKVTYYRAAIVIFYSHWEGFVKNSSLAYLAYLNKLAPKYNLMKDNFFCLGMSFIFDHEFSSKSISNHRKVHEHFNKRDELKFKVDPQKVINVRANLNYEAIRVISHQIGVPLDNLELREHFIDKVLLKYRNSLAHGEKVSDSELSEVYGEIYLTVLNYIEGYRDLISNAASAKLYLK